MTHTHRCHAAVFLALAMVDIVGGQPPGELPVDWKKAESLGNTEYRQALDASNSVTDKILSFLRTKALPQLAAQGNRSTIERTRRRMREFLLRDVADPKAFEEISRIVLDYMMQLAVDPQAEPVVRVNAMLLVGELRNQDNKQPWQPAVSPLAATVADTGLPVAIRIAAMGGLTRHIDSWSTDGGQPATTKAVSEALVAVLAAVPGKDDPSAASWLLSRVLAVLPAALTPLPKDVAALVMKVLADANQPIDVRVRAAAALGAGATTDSGIDAVKAIDVIKRIAIESLTHDLDAVTLQRRDARFDKIKVDDPPALAELACRRNAWRLVTLADAILLESEAAGLATLLRKPASDAAAAYARSLRSEGLKVDRSPQQSTIEEVRKALEKQETVTDPPQQSSTPGSKSKS